MSARKPVVAANWKMHKTVAETAAFLDGVRRGRNPIPLEEIDNVHRACFAAVESLSTGAPVRL